MGVGSLILMNDDPIDEPGREERERREARAVQTGSFSQNFDLRGDLSYKPAEAAAVAVASLFVSVGRLLSWCVSCSPALVVLWHRGVVALLGRCLCDSQLLSLNNASSQVSSNFGDACRGVCVSLSACGGPSRGNKLAQDLDRTS